MVGQTVLHYRILEKLGEGGMGVVYKAHDTRLDRMVALKFLPHQLTADKAEQSRFLQEARAAAALNHPNVCSVIDIEESDGQQFIVMEYVDGVTLRQKTPVAKIDEALGYAIQIGEALQAAHARGIVHRDVKSENVMVTADGRVKVMDFGLAKLAGVLADGEDKLDCWDACLYGAGADPGWRCRCPLGYFFVWRCPLRVAHGQAPVSG